MQNCYLCSQGSLSDLLWALNGLGLPEPRVLLFTAQDHPELEQSRAVREAGILLCTEGSVFRDIPVGSHGRSVL